MQQYNIYMNLMNILLLLGVVVRVGWAQSPRKLVYVQELFRHGARYPIFASELDNSIYAREEKAEGELTRQGKSMHYQLGKLMYGTYWGDLFGSDPLYNNSYGQSKFFIKSTNINRTIESAQSHIMGLFELLPPLKITGNELRYSYPPWNVTKSAPQGNIYANAATYHPTPVHVQKGIPNPYDNGDFLRLYSPEFCFNQQKWVQYNLNTARAIEIMSDPRYVAAIQELSKALNTTVPFTQVYQFVDNYHCMQFGSRTNILPIWSNSQVVAALQSIYTVDLYLKYFDTQLQLGATATAFFDATFQDVNRVRKSTEGVQWVLYSAHDTTLGNILAALNLSNVECVYDAFKRNLTADTDTCIWKYPTFASSLVFEVYKYPNSTHTMQIRYNGRLRQIPFCNYSLECSIESAQSWFKAWRNPDYLTTCGVKNADSEVYLSVAIVLFIVLIVVGLLYLIGYLKRKTLGKRTVGVEQSIISVNNE